MPTRSLAVAATLALLCCLVAAGCASAPQDPAQEPETSGPIRVEEAWAQHTALREGERLVSGATSAIYFKLANTGAEPDSLIEVRTEVARSATLHQSVAEGDVVRMLPVNRIEVPAGGTVELSRGGLHVMLMGLTRNLVPGEHFQAVLVLEKAGEVPIEVEVRAG